MQRKNNICQQQRILSFLNRKTLSQPFSSSLVLRIWKLSFFWDPGARLFNPPSHIVEWHVRWSGDGLRGGSGNDFGTGHIPATPRYEQPGYRKTLNLSGIFSFSFPAKTRFHTFYLSGHIWTAKFSPTNYDNLLTVLARLARRLHNIRQTVFK